MAFRCDGGDRVGAGHVARCLQIAAAFRMGGDEPLFVGSYDGMAARLLEAQGMPTTEPLPERALGLPAEVDAAVLDSYEIAPEEAGVPVASIVDVPGGGEGAVTVDYHPDAEGADLSGPDYAPVAPVLTTARRPRGFEQAFVTAGGGEAGESLAQRATASCMRHGLVVDRSEPVGLREAITFADVAVAAAGVTAYELACAGVPSALIPIAGNQRRIAAAFDAAGLALTGPDPEPLVAELAAEATRERLAAAGPAAIDGYGAFRVRDGLRALFRGEPPPPVLRFRPATPADSPLQLAWRNEPDARAASRQGEEIGQEEHERWFAGVLADPDRWLLVIEDSGGPAGSVRFDVAGREAEISIVIAPGRRGGGIGTRTVREASELTLASLPTVERVRAEVLPGNEASRAAFRRAGFSEALVLDRAALASPPA